MSVQRPLPADDLGFITTRASALWPQLKGARFLITGATGFFGRWMLESLFDADRQLGLGIHVTALSRDPEAFLSRVPHLRRPRLVWLRGSVATLSPESWEGGSLDTVVHLATEADMRASAANPDAAAAVIAGGTRRTLEVAAQSGARRLLLTSSGAVYGLRPGGAELLSEESPEADPGASDSPYAHAARAKLGAEKLCADFAGGPACVIARCFSFAGPALPMDSKFAFGNFVGDALAGGPVVVRGDGSPIRSYLYAADLAVWLWTVLLRGAPGGVYNVGSERPVSILELARAVAGELGIADIRVVQEPGIAGVADRYVPSTQRARSQFGLRENFSLEEMIRRTAAWSRGAVKH